MLLKKLLKKILCPALLHQYTILHGRIYCQTTFIELGVYERSLKLGYYIKYLMLKITRNISYIGYFLFTELANMVLCKSHLKEVYFCINVI